MTDVSSSAPDRQSRFRRSARDWDRIARWAIVVGAVLRVLWILILHPPVRFIYSDMLGYVERAARLASGAPLTPVDAFFPPGTDILLAVPLGLLGVAAGVWVAAVLWCVLSIVTVLLAWRLTRTLLTPAAAAITAVLCALSPLFITYGGYFTSETPALAFLIASLWAGVEATRRQGRAALLLALFAGALGGAAAATRPQLLINVLILVAVTLIGRRTKAAVSACLVGGLLAVLALVVAHNSVASGQLTGLARNGGVNFWFGHCDARSVTTTDARDVRTYAITHPVPAQTGRGSNFVVRNHEVWDEQLFVDLGWQCIERDGPGHALRMARNVLDMTATTTPWPQSGTAGWPRLLVQAANVAYSVLVPFILIGSMTLVRRRRREGAGGGEAFLLVNLACVVVVAVLVIGDPRVRTVYDVFGLALLGALLASWLRLDDALQTDRDAVAAS